MTRTELLENYLKPTDLTVKELIDRNAFTQIMQFAEAYRLEQLRIGGVSNCNAKNDTNIENTILLISRKDGLTDVYDNSGCLGKGLDTQEINDLNIT